MPSILPGGVNLHCSTIKEIQQKFTKSTGRETKKNQLRGAQKHLVCEFLKISGLLNTIGSDPYRQFSLE